MIVQVPYGKTTIPVETDGAVLQSAAHTYRPTATEEALVRGALEAPIGTKRLCKLAVGKRHALLITSDHTRPVPSRVTMPLLLAELRRENPNIEVKILIATGVHRPTTREELIEKCGSAIVEQEEIIVHHCENMAEMAFKGILPSGGELWLNSLVDWADLVLSEGFIEPHFFAGFSGGRKSILPGIAAKKTVLANHCSSFIASPAARAGNLVENPLHQDMLFAAEQARLAFILNVVIDAKKSIIAAFAGAYDAAHEAGCAFVQKQAAVTAVPAPIVIVGNGGHPLDQNIYQAVKGMRAAAATVTRGGVIIMAASCGDGHGGEDFYHWFRDADSPAEVAKKIAQIDSRNTLPDQWEAQILADILTTYSVIMVTECAPALVEDMFMTYAPNMDAAINMAKAKTGSDCITVMPDGVSVIVMPENGGQHG